MDLSQVIKDNIDSIYSNIQNLGGGNLAPQVIAVTKTHPIETIQIAYQHGMRHFGENYAKEFEAKAKALNLSDIQWHYLGKLQSNKIKIIATHADCVHSLYDIRHAKLLNQYRNPLKPLQVLIEVNISNEENKSGLIDISEIINLAIAIQEMPNLHLRGLMGMASRTKDVNLIQRQFTLLSDILQQLNNDGFNLDQLSMGMSADYHVAISSGATLIRVGDKIFGKRKYLPN